MFKKLFSSTVALAALALASTASANLIISIGQSGGNDPVNIDSPRAWNFGVTEKGAAYFLESGLTFDSSLFDAKLHKDTTAPLVFTVYSGLGGDVNGNTMLTTVSVPASQFTNQYSGGLGRLFLFDPQTFGVGYYSVTLTTTAPDKSTQDYFLKQGKLSLLDSNGVALPSDYWLQDQGTGNATSTFNGTGSLYNGGGVNAAMAPEPGSMFAMAAIMGVSFAGGFARRFRKQA